MLEYNQKSHPVTINLKDLNKNPQLLIATAFN